MYSQYQYYQQSNQPVTAQQGATSWNGSAWVANASPSMTSSTYSTYEQPVKPVTIPPNPVETFTEYYHAWTAHGKECEEYLRHLPGNNSQRPNMQRQVEWAKYYADESSRAAHHFYSNPNATSAPFDLPPAPPKSSQNKQQQTPQQQQQQQPRHVQQQQQQQQQAPKQSSSDENTPGSLTRYVKRCIDQCSTDEQRKAVQAEVEKAIAKAIQTGELHTKNWALVPLIPVPGNNKLSFSIAPQPNNKHHIRQQQQQYGTSKHSPLDNVFNNKNRAVGKSNTTTKYSKRYDDKLPANDSYYGHGGGEGGGNTSPPSSNTSHHRRGSNFSDSSFGRRTSNQNSGGYYGPASESQQQSYGPSSRYIDNSNTASYYGAADSSSPLSSSQKRVISPDEDFIAFQQKRKQKKQKKNGFEKSDKALAKRANRFSGPGGISDASKSASTVDGHDQYMGKKLIGGSKATLDEEDFQKMTVKGTCNTLEKEYLRLTAPPRAELVRPKPILERHLENLKQAYAKKKRDYLWFCSQLKAIRQDCTVQRIQEAFTVDVYETHARIALQEGDLNEYNQCQTQLKELYELGHSMGNEDEFIAYRLLYYVFLTTNEKYDGGSSDMFKILLSLTAVQRKHTAIAHALNTREALASGDYLQFFRLHQNSPGLSGYLSDLIVPTMRMRGLRRMVKAYRPSLQVEVFQNQLGFDSMKDCTDFLTNCGCAVEGTTCVTKDSTVHEPVEEKKNSLI